jgi:GntR family transcriptional regulator
MAGVTEQVEQYYRSVLDQLTSGEQLPSERTVMQEMGACRSTIRLVLTKLAAQQLLYPIHGRGYFKV